MSRKYSLDACEISPVCSSKVATTPRRPRNKASRSDRGIDVHTVCSTPHSNHSPRGVYSNSPTSSFPYSQENCPDVVWDYSSPKLPKGAKKKELKLTIQELLDNLNKCQVPECSNQQSAPYVKLLESWMSNQSIRTTEKKIQKVPLKKENKKRSRQVVEELRKFLETMAGANRETATNSPLRNNTTDPQQKVKMTTPKLNVSAQAFIEGESTENDSMDELWGDADTDSFIVKATQELDSVSANTDPNSGQVSTIPETDPSMRSNPKNSNSVAIDMDKYSDLLEHLSNVDWDSDVDTDEWDKGFLAEDDALGLVPDDVLSGNVAERHLNTVELVSDKSCDKTRSEKEVSCDSRPVEDSGDMFNSFEEDSFDDASLFFRPEIMSQLEEVESMASQAPKCTPEEAPKCTPEEIEKKKDEALKRRLRSHSSKKS